MTVDRRFVAAIRASVFRCLMAGVASLPCVFAAMCLAEPASAQTTPGSPGVVSLGDLFIGPDRVDLKPGAAAKLQEAAGGAVNPPDVCPQQAYFKVIVKSGDPQSQQALAAKRRDVVDAALKNQGIPESQYEVTHAVQGGVDDVQVSYGRMRDRQRPSLQTSWVPPKGTKVKPGDRITATMVARDNANRMQTGIQSIQLVARSLAGDARVGGEAYPTRSDCQGMPEERRLVLTYTVPPNPPPVVRLVAVAEDFVNLSDHDIGEFPIGDWHGTFTAVSFTVGRDLYRTQADIALNHDGRGNLTGTMAGQQEFVAYSLGDCSYRTIQPNRFRASLVGVHTDGRSFKVAIKEVEETKLIWEANCRGHQRPVHHGGQTFRTAIWPPEALLGTPSPLGDGEILADGTRQYKIVSETGGVGTTWTVTLRPTRN
jgi:hypothetical protein